MLMLIYCTALRFKYHFPRGNLLWEFTLASSLLAPFLAGPQDYKLLIANIKHPVLRKLLLRVRNPVLNEKDLSVRG